MEQYTKPNMEIIILLADDVISMSCSNDCGNDEPIELPDLPS